MVARFEDLVGDQYEDVLGQVPRVILHAAGAIGEAEARAPASETDLHEVTPRVSVLLVVTRPLTPHVEEAGLRVNGVEAVDLIEAVPIHTLAETSTVPVHQTAVLRRVKGADEAAAPHDGLPPTVRGEEGVDAPSVEILIVTAMVAEVVIRRDAEVDGRGLQD